MTVFPSARASHSLCCRTCMPRPEVPSREWVREARSDEFRRVAGLCADAFVEVPTSRASATSTSSTTRSLRRAQRAVLAAVMEVSLVQRAIVAAFFQGRAERLREKPPMTQKVLVVESPEGEALVAACELRLRETSVAYLSSVVVAPRWRRQGHARRLLRSAEKAARRWGCEAIILDARQDNVPAAQLYESAGFRPVGWTPVAELELECLLDGKGSRRWSRSLRSSADAEADEEPSNVELAVELTRRVLYQVILGLFLAFCTGALSRSGQLCAEL
ncbi:unnamed protein product [Symbiodinium natans]|uniref:N-acetyltransferase domain-containing protein n=1 Tax=Symbiodinium natans TaxID=878477 RepID=A0A812RFL9_9DINO|nr:unnamed protein product [Symbiodinium natans]